MISIEDFKSYSEKQKEVFLSYVKGKLKSKYKERNPDENWKEFTKGVSSYIAITADIFSYLKTKLNSCSGSKQKENYFIKDEKDNTVLSASQIRDLVGNKKPIKATGFELLLEYAEIDEVAWEIKEETKSPVITAPSRRTFLKRLGFGLGIFSLLIAGGTGTYYYKEKQIKTLKLWSTILDEKDIEDDEDLKILYKKLMEPINQLIYNLDGNTIEGLGEIKDLVYALLMKKSVQGKLPTCLDSLPDEIGEEATTVYGDKQVLTFDFSNGVSAYYPMDSNVNETRNYEACKKKAMDNFSGFNKVLTQGSNKYTSLEEGLEKKLNINNNGRAEIRPLLIYSLFFPEGNKGDDYSTSDKYEEVYMYRYPQYIKKDSANPLKPYENYSPYKRPFFQDFIHHDNALKIATANEVGHDVWLSSIYSDYNKKTIDPIRTLMVEIDGGENSDDGLFLLCVDFKHIK